MEPIDRLRIGARAALAAVVIALAVGCAQDEPEAGPTPLPDDTTGPYVSVAVDNHFHDIHPEDAKTIAADRAFVIRNEGRNLHNVTIPGTEINEDVRPGRSLEFDPVGEHLQPGTYEIICKYHDYVGMTGQIIIVD